MTDMYKIVLTWADMGEGVSKIAKKVLTYFMDGPLENLLRAMMHGQASKTSKATTALHWRLHGGRRRRLRRVASVHKMGRCLMMM